MAIEELEVLVSIRNKYLLRFIILLPIPINTHHEYVDNKLHLNTPLHISLVHSRILIFSHHVPDLMVCLLQFSDGVLFQ